MTVRIKISYYQFCGHKAAIYHSLCEEHCLCWDCASLVLNMTSLKVEFGKFTQNTCVRKAINLH